MLLGLRGFVEAAESCLAVQESRAMPHSRATGLTVHIMQLQKWELSEALFTYSLQLLLLRKCDVLDEHFQ